MNTQVKTARITWAGYLLFLGAGPAHAYLDPGAGSIMLQILLGGIAGMAVILKLYWEGVKAFFSRFRPSVSPEQKSED